MKNTFKQVLNEIECCLSSLQVVDKNTKKNILLIIPHLTDGGAERVVSELSYALSEKFNVFLLLYEDRVTYPFSGKKIVLNTPPQFSNSILKNLDMFFSIWKIKKEHDIDCSVSFLESPNLVNIFTRRKEKVILTVHTHLTEFFKRKKWTTQLHNKLIVKLIYNRADYIISVSKGIEEDLISNFGLKKEKLKTIYNFYDLTRIKTLADYQLDINHVEIFKKPVVINIGRLTYSKGQWNLIKAFQRVKQELDVNLIILGAGKYSAKYKSIIKKLGLEDSVFLLGFQSNPYSLLKRASVLVSSSKFEGLSNVIIESLALGTPVISTDCKTGPREILAPSLHNTKLTERMTFHEFGVLVPVIHPEEVNTTNDHSFEENEMAIAILRVLQDKDTRKKYSQAGLSRANYFKADRQVGKWIKLLEES